MTSFQRRLNVASLYCLMGAAVLVMVSATWAIAGDNPPSRIIEVELTESFYEALRDEGNRKYSTNQSEEYLRQIAVSARYAVESNLKIIKQQEHIIELLARLNQKK